MSEQEQDERFKNARKYAAMAPVAPPAQSRWQDQGLGLAPYRLDDSRQMVLADAAYVNALEAEVAQLRTPDQCKQMCEAALNGGSCRCSQLFNELPALEAEIEALRVKAGLADRAVEFVELALNGAIAMDFLGKDERAWLADYNVAQEAQEPS